MRRRHPLPLAVSLQALAVLACALLVLTLPAPVDAQPGGSSGNRPFVGIWRLDPGKSHLPAPPNGFAVYRQYEDHGGGWMYHTVITITPRRTDFLFTAARYDSKQYPVYNAANLGSFIRGGERTPRTVEFTRIDANKFLWTDRFNGRVVAGGVCTVSADGNTLTITNQPPGQQTMTEQVFDRVSPGSLAQAPNAGFAPVLAQGAKPRPGTEAAARRQIEALQATGQPLFSDMVARKRPAPDPQLAARVSAFFRNLGALRSITFEGVLPNGYDAYRATFANGQLNMGIGPLSPDGKVTGLSLLLPRP